MIVASGRHCVSACLTMVFGAEHVRRNNHQSQGMEGPNSARGVISKARAEVLAAKLAEPQRRYAVQAP